MKTLEEFISQAGASDIRLRTNTESPELRPSDDDALFHTPLLALSILIIARARKNSLETSEIAVWTGAILATRFHGTPGLRWNLQWSLPLRRRCADALVFLENIGLVSVKTETQRTINVSESGIQFIERIARSPTDIGILARSLVRAYNQAQAKGLQLL